MSLENAAYVSQIVGVAAILGSLVFVGLQIGHQTKATRAQTQHSIASSYVAVAQLIADHAEAFSAGIMSRDPAFSDLSNVDRLKFLSTVFVQYKHYENMFVQYENGLVDKAAWEPWSYHMRLYFHQPGVQSWWAIRKDSFTPAFRAFLEKAPRPEAPSPAFLQSGDGERAKPSG